MAAVWYQQPKVVTSWPWIDISGGNFVAFLNAKTIKPEIESRFATVPCGRHNNGRNLGKST